MSAIKPIMRELKQAALKGFGHSKDKLHHLADNVANHVDDVAKRVRGQDKFEGRDAPWALRGGWDRNASTRPNDFTDGGRYDHPHKNDRPDPESYLSEGYIEQHLARFEGGATRFYREDSLGKYGPGNAGTTFVFPTSEIDSIIAQADGDPQRLGEMLGLGANFFVDDKGNSVNIVRADFSFEDLAAGDLRMPRGDEGGANKDWLAGGYLPEGIPEAVFNVPGAATGADPSIGGTFGSFDSFDV